MKICNILRQTAQFKFKAGDFVRETRIVTQQDLDAFSSLTGDHNTVHKIGDSKNPLVHGALLNSLVAGIIGTKLPGPGTIVISQTFTFPSKCFANDPIEFSVQLLDTRKIMEVKYECKQNKILVFQGTAKVVLNLYQPK